MSRAEYAPSETSLRRVHSLGSKSRFTPQLSVTKRKLYVGDGDDLEPPKVFGFSGMSAIIMLKNHAYLAGEVTAGDGKVLVVHCKFTNLSPADQTLHPLDLRLSWSDNARWPPGPAHTPLPRTLPPGPDCGRN
jgi:hypothetical protein